MSNRRILRNRARCRKCGDTIESRSVHDYRTCRCRALSVDGGREYIKRGGSPGQIDELSEWEEPKP